MGNLVSDILNTGLDIVGAKRDRNREDRFRSQDRANFLRDRNHAEEFDSQYFQRRVADAKAAGLSPSAILGAQVSGPAFAHQAQGYQGHSRPGQLNLLDQSSVELNKAQIRKLDAETDLVRQQGQDSLQARLGQKTTPEKFVRIPGADIHSSDPAYFAQDEENKYGEIADIDGALMRFLDAVKLTTDAWYHYGPLNSLRRALDGTRLFNDSPVFLESANSGQ